MGLEAFRTKDWKGEMVEQLSRERRQDGWTDLATGWNRETAALCPQVEIQNSSNKFIGDKQGYMMGIYTIYVHIYKALD